MEPERLIIELVRDKLRAAREEYAEAKAEQSYTGGIVAAERAHNPEHAEERVEQMRCASVAYHTARLAVEAWGRALSVALDKLMRG